ncbi:MAG TPA: hypothetical protein VKM72_12925 [Thermoanaerobaculia bacterium]|nr:hypothetical protein [Thermoanaerobaculia bacterium]
MAHARPTTHTVKQLPEPAIPGTVTVDIIEVLVEGLPQLFVHLSGSGDGWSTSGTSLQLTPEHTPAHYHLTFELSSASINSSFFMVGAQVFFQTEEVNTRRATIFTPASELGKVKLAFLHDIVEGDSVTYQLFFGVIKDGHLFWPDPTIEFEPEAGSPPFDPTSEE